MKKIVREKFIEYVEDDNRHRIFEGIAPKGSKLRIGEINSRIAYAEARKIFAAGFKACEEAMKK